MSPNYYNEQMCEAKMDPESPESEDTKSDMRVVTALVNGKAPLSRTSSNSGGTNNSVKDDEFLHHHHHDHHDPPMTPQSQLEEDEEEGGEDGDISTDDMISVGGSPSPAISNLPESRRPSHRSRNSLLEENIDEYFRPFKKLRMVKVEPPSSQSPAGLKSFSISDILSHKPSKSPTGISPSNHHGNHRSVDISGISGSSLLGGSGGGGGQQRIVRPWDAQQQLQQQNHHSHHHGHHHRHSHHGGGDNQSKSNGRRNSDSSPLDALFQMTSKTFEGLNGHHDQEIGGHGNANQAFSSRQPPKKKRKSRTAFTNHQIFELEKRFLYQKYLSPADRDDIAQQLGLTNAQVITWFQNRRAKLKRDVEELRKDVESAKILSAHNSLMESAQELGVLRKRTQSHVDMMNPAAASFHISSPTSSSFSSHSPINLTSESPPSAH